MILLCYYHQADIVDLYKHFHLKIATNIFITHSAGIPY